MGRPDISAVADGKGLDTEFTCVCTLEAVSFKTWYMLPVRTLGRVLWVRHFWAPRIKVEYMDKRTKVGTLFVEWWKWSLCMLSYIPCNTIKKKKNF